MQTISPALSAARAEGYYNGDYQALMSFSDSLRLSTAQRMTEARAVGAIFDRIIPGEWGGGLTGELGLNEKTVSRKKFRELARGIHPLTGEQLIRNVKPREKTDKFGNIKITNEHRAGWDLTFSAPKSVSLAALIGGDARLIEAHRRSVDKALEETAKYIEARMGNTKPSVRTGKCVMAVFLHDLARPDRATGYAAPDLHSHSFLFNLTKTKDKKFRSVQPYEIFANQKFATAIYRAELARHLRKLGYAVRVDQRTGAPEIDGISRAYIEASSPRQTEIKKRAIEMGIANTKKVAHLNRPKKNFDRQQMRERHFSLEEEFGGEAQTVVRNAKVRTEEFRLTAETEAKAKTSSFPPVIPATETAANKVNKNAEARKTVTVIESTAITKNTNYLGNETKPENSAEPKVTWKADRTSQKTVSVEAADYAVEEARKDPKNTNWRTLVTAALQHRMGEIVFDEIREELDVRLLRGELKDFDLEKRLTSKLAKAKKTKATGEANHEIKSEKDLTVSAEADSEIKFAPNTQTANGLKLRSVKEAERDSNQSPPKSEVQKININYQINQSEEKNDYDEFTRRETEETTLGAETVTVSGDGTERRAIGSGGETGERTVKSVSRTVSGNGIDGSITDVQPTTSVIKSGNLNDEQRGNSESNQHDQGVYSGERKSSNRDGGSRRSVQQLSRRTGTKRTAIDEDLRDTRTDRRESTDHPQRGSDFEIENAGDVRIFDRDNLQSSENRGVVEFTNAAETSPTVERGETESEQFLQSDSIGEAITDAGAATGKSCGAKSTAARREQSDETEQLAAESRFADGEPNEAAGKSNSEFLSGKSGRRRSEISDDEPISGKDLSAFSIDPHDGGSEQVFSELPRATDERAEFTKLGDEPKNLSVSGRTNSGGMDGGYSGSDSQTGGSRNRRREDQGEAGQGDTGRIEPSISGLQSNEGSEFNTDDFRSGVQPLAADNDLLDVRLESNLNESPIQQNNSNSGDLSDRDEPLENLAEPRTSTETLEPERLETDERSNRRTDQTDSFFINCNDRSANFSDNDSAVKKSFDNFCVDNTADFAARNANDGFTPSESSANDFKLKLLSGEEQEELLDSYRRQIDGYFDKYRELSYVNNAANAQIVEMARNEEGDYIPATVDNPAFSSYSNAEELNSSKTAESPLTKQSSVTTQLIDEAQKTREIAAQNQSAEQFRMPPGQSVAPDEQFFAAEYQYVDDDVPRRNFTTVSYISEPEAERDFWKNDRIDREQRIQREKAETRAAMTDAERAAFDRAEAVAAAARELEYLEELAREKILE